MGCRFKFGTQKLPYERILGNFSDFIDFGQQVRVCKKDHFSILPVFKIYGIYIYLGYRFEFGKQKLPYERISGNFSDFADLNLERKNYPMKEFGQFSDFIDFGQQVRVCKKRSFLNITCNSNIWDLHIFGLQIWIWKAKITLWKNFGQFFRFYQFWSSGPRCEKRPVFILAVISKCMGFT